MAQGCRPAEEAVGTAQGAKYDRAPVSLLDDCLARLDVTHPSRPSLGALEALHEQHLLRVPFENLDIHEGIRIVLDEERIVDKIVNRRRGGFCEAWHRVLKDPFGILLPNHGAPSIEEAHG